MPPKSPPSAAPERRARPQSPKRYHCPVEATLDVIGGKWKPLILWWLRQGTHRFSELRRRMPAVTEKVLAQQLRELERDGVVRRTVHAAVPPRVEYSLTEYGQSLEEALLAICTWGREHMRRIGAETVALTAGNE